MIDCRGNESCAVGLRDIRSSPFSGFFFSGILECSYRFGSIWLRGVRRSLRSEGAS